MLLAPGPQCSDAGELEPAAPRSRVKHSTTEQLSSHNCTINFVENYMVVKLKSSMMYSKTCVKRPLSIRLKIGFQDQL